MTETLPKSLVSLLVLTATAKPNYGQHATGLSLFYLHIPNNMQYFNLSPVNASSQ